MRKLNVEEMDLVAGAGDPCCSKECPEPTKKGNNGWGNGAEGTNPGSDKGGTAGSKSDELWTSGDGPRPDKFTTR